MNAVQLFDFNRHNVRVIIDKDNKVWFVAKDICDILGYVNSSDAIDKHCRVEGIAKMDTLTNGGIQNMTIINEGNLYRLVFKSKKKEAEKFESWVCDELLSTIRQTGSYTATSKPVSHLELMQHSVDFLVAQENRIIQLEAGLTLLKAHIQSRPDYFTVVGYANIKQRPLAPKIALFLGKQAASLCRSNGHEILKVGDEHCGEINSYPDTVLKEVFERYVG